MKANKNILRYLLIFSVVSGDFAAQAAEQSACEKVRERANSKAALLFYPKLNITGLRIPLGTAVDETSDPVATNQSKWQVRAHLGFSPLDIYKGTVVLDLAEEKCKQILAQESLEDLLVQGPNYGHSPALRRQVKYLVSQRAKARELEAQQQRRYKKQLITMAEMRAISMRRASFERHLLGLEEKLAYLDANDIDQPQEFITSVLENYEAATRRFERVESKLRKIDPWRIDINGGASWVGKPDWFATIGLSYSFGAISQGSAEDRYLEAVDRELAHSARSLSLRLRTLIRYLNESTQRYRTQLSLVKKQLVDLQKNRAKINSVETSKKQQLLVLLEFDAYELEGNKIYLEEMIATRERIR